MRDFGGVSQAKGYYTGVIPGQRGRIEEWRGSLTGNFRSPLFLTDNLTVRIVRLTTSVGPAVCAGEAAAVCSVGFLLSSLAVVRPRRSRNMKDQLEADCSPQDL